ncbi:MAG TPA: CHAD domain-containing protein [Terriglobales bacterium]
MAVDSHKVQRPLKKMGKLIKKISGSPSIEEVHSLRTHTRQIEAAFAALEVDSMPKYRKLLRGTSKIRRRAGKVRDMDVLIEYGASTRIADNEGQCLVQLLEELGARRGRQAKRLSNLVRNNRRKFLRQLRRVSKRVHKLLPESDSQRMQKISPIVAGSAMSVAAKLAEPRQLNRGNLHPYRLKVKELRNVLKLASEDTEPKLLEQLGDVKDAIGTWHDWEVLVSIASETLDHTPSCQLLKKLKETAQQKFREALKQAETFRHENSAGLTQKRARKQKTVSQQPILSAVAGLAV